jgi:hypothetical protein
MAETSQTTAAEPSVRRKEGETLFAWIIRVIDTSVNRRLAPMRKTVKADHDEVVKLRTEVETLKGPLFDPTLFAAAEAKMKELDDAAAAEISKELASPAPRQTN